jgi:WD40 repeat protein
VSTLFISHSSADDEAVADLCARLGERGFESVFVDFDAEHGIPAGAAWERELLHKLRLADALVFVGSQASAASEWCLVELGFAHAARTPIFPVALERGVRLTSLQSWQWVELSQPGGLDRLVRALTERLGAAGSLPWDHRRAPYPGLVPFEADDAAVFFGRDDIVAAVLGRLDVGFGRRRAVALVGASGAGKSSIVRAGVAPRLQRERQRWLVLSPMTPGERPLGALARAAEREVEDADDFRALAVTPGGRERSVLLIVDQAEELLALSRPDERRDFVSLLSNAITARGPLWVVLTLRSEYLDAALSDDGLRALIGEPIAVPALDRSRFAEVILAPAKRAGIDFAAGLPERMVEETEGGDALPLLAYTLRELQERAGNHDVTTADYQAVGGVVGAVRDGANRIAESVDGDALPTLLRLVTFDAAGRAVRRPVPIESFDDRERAIIDAFVEGRLLVTSGRGFVHPAHEALLRVWPPLAEAIEASRERLQAQADLGRLAAEWLEHDRKASYLLREERLAAARRHVDALEPDARAFVEASVRAEKRHVRRLRRLNWTLAGVAIAALVVGGFAWDQRNEANTRQQEAERQERSARSRSLAAQAVAELDRSLDRALLLALQSYKTEPSPEARNASITALQRAAPRRAILAGAQPANDGVTPPYFVAGPRGESLLSTDPETLGADNSVLRLWNVRTRDYLELRGYREPFSDFHVRAGSRVLVVSPKRQLEVWDLVTRHRVGAPLDFEGVDAWTDLALSPDGTALISHVDYSGELRLWDLKTRAPRGEVLVPPRRSGASGSFVSALAFSPDGRWFVRSDGGRALIWDLEATPRRRFSIAVPEFVPLAFDTERGLLMAMPADGRAWSWRLSDLAAPPRRFRVFDARDRDKEGELALSPDATRVAYVRTDGTVALTSIRRPQISMTLRPSGTVGLLAFSPDGRSLVSSAAQAIEVWDVEAPASGDAFGPRDAIDAAIDAAGRRVAIAREDGSIDVWPIGEAKPRSLVGVRGKPGVVFRDDGMLLSSHAIEDKQGITRNRITLWDVDRSRARPLLTGQYLETLGNGRVITTVHFSGPHMDLIFWDTGQARELSRFRVTQFGLGKEPPEGVYVADNVAVTPDGALAAVATSNEVAVVDTATGKRVTRIPDDELFKELAWSGNSRLLAIGTEAGVRFWDRDRGPRDGVLRDPNREQDNDVKLGLSADGQTLASVGNDLRFYDTSTRRQLGAATPLDARGLSATGFARSADAFVSISRAGVTLWDPVLWGDDRALFERRTCELVGRNLSRMEWSQAQPGEPYRKTCPQWP